MWLNNGRLEKKKNRQPELCCSWAYLVKENLSFWNKKGSLFNTIISRTEQFLSIERVGYLILGDDKEIKYYIVIKKAFVNVLSFIANPERLQCGDHVPISFSVMPPKKIYILPVQLSQMYHTFRKIFNFGFYLNILDKPPSKFILKKNSASY